MVLAHVGRDDRIPILRQLVQSLDHLLRLDRTILLLLIGQGMSLLPFSDLIPPGLSKVLLLTVDGRA